jgi:ornithine carbamoyltransferase
MGQEAERDARAHALRPFQVTPELMALASPEAIFMHCLPAKRGEEVAAAVIDGPNSRVWQQAANRMHAARGALLWLLDDEAS